MKEYRQLMQTEALPCEWQETGLLYVFRTDQGMHEFAETDRFLTEHFDVSARRIAGAELSDFDPALKPGLAGAYYYDGDASLRPDLLNRAWTLRLQDRGVEFKENCLVQQVERDNRNLLSLQTSLGSFVSDHYVFAMGAWSPKLASELGCQLPIQPGKGYSVTMSRPERCPKYPMLFPEHRVGVSPFHHGYRLGSMMEFSGYDSSIDPRRIAQLRRSAEPYLWTPHTAEEQERWYGWRPMTWDSLPLIGPVPTAANAHIAAGHNMLGLSLATATGRLIAEMLTGEPTHIPVEAFRVDRF
jgi:D-amino-acid dehydrogenase